MYFSPLHYLIVVQEQKCMYPYDIYLFYFILFSSCCGWITHFQLIYSKERINNTKYMIMSCHPNSGQNRNIRIGNESLEMQQNSNTWG